MLESGLMGERHLTMTVDVGGIGTDGCAWAIADGRRVSIDNAIPGERVEIAITERSGACLAGQVTRFIRTSPERVDPVCRHFGPCGGCTWQHIGYEAQLRLKRDLVQALLDRALGPAAPSVAPAVASAPWGFRDKIHFVFAPASRTGGLVMGHYRRGSQSVVPIEECPVHAPAGNRVAFSVRDALARRGIPAVTSDLSRGLVRHLVVRVSEATAQRGATLVVRRNDVTLRPAVRAVLAGADAPDALYVNVHPDPGSYLFGRNTVRLHGADRLREEIGGTSFLVSPTAFFQTNVRAAATMLRIVLEHVGANARVLDLYAGAGLFALPLAGCGARVTAVEENREAVADGEASRRLNRIAESVCRFLTARIEDLAAGRHGRRIEGRPDVVVLDPPRQGCSRRVLDWLTAVVGPSRIIYVSCNPEALATDLAILTAARYQPAMVQPIDVFPHTAHVETIAVLDKVARR
jgi:23S rRNA (uracil1939-C5)-methyltransferase